jgi:uncharacterized membrane protein YphA (DoxX/SURF4 family)
MKIALWIVQVLLAAFFIMVGFAKLATPMAELAAQMDWVPAVAPSLVRFIGVAEIAGGLGLLLPALTRIQPWLTPLAAVGLIVVMILAAGFHATRAEFGPIIFNLVLLALAAFIAYGRWKLVPIASR